jgi:hypothetical protein
VKDVFMRIEQPELPRVYRQRPRQVSADCGFATVGEFYAAIIERIRALGNGIFKGNPGHQVVDPAWFPIDQLFDVTDVDSAVRALSIIRQQAEGSLNSPMNAAGEPAHYYRFKEILRGRQLVRDGKAPLGYAFKGARVPLDPAGILDLLHNSKLADYIPRSLAYSGVAQSSYTYTSLLNALHQTFNGEPKHLRTALGLMFELRAIVAEKVLNQRQHPDAAESKCAAPSFEFSLEAAGADRKMSARFAPESGYPPSQ